MIAFRVEMNDKRIAVAGLRGRHVLTAILTSVVRDPEVVRLALPRRLPISELEFTLSGLHTHPGGAQDSVSWCKKIDLKAGDRITIEVVEVESADPPIHAARTPAPSIEHHELQVLHHLQKKYPNGPGKIPAKRPTNKLKRTESPNRRSTRKVKGTRRRLRRRKPSR